MHRADALARGGHLMMQLRIDSAAVFEAVKLQNLTS